MNEEEFERISEENANLVKIEDGEIHLNDNGSAYSIELDRCDTFEKIVEWIYHLSLKPWVTTKHIRLFISHAARFHNLPLDTLQS